MEEQQKVSKETERRKETLFRVTYRHQSKLIQIADNKAGIIISINTMIISSIIAIIGYGFLTSKINEFGLNLIIPISMIIVFCLVSLILAILSSQPKLIIHKDFDDPVNRSSLLFFGVIAAHTQKDYLSKLRNVLHSGEEMYEHMVIDLYYQGVILKKKYTLLVYAYYVLMIGFVFSVTTFLGFLLYCA